MIAPPDLEDAIFSPLLTAVPSPTLAASSYPPDNRDSSNHRGGEQTETEESHNIILPTENQQTDKIGGAPTTTDKIGGD